ncbi:MAG TPA: ABC transporter substrate-binding protein [Bacillota bacterium]|nr:ABC transporter substrate-binding protein [Bacillota bacterium]
MRRSIASFTMLIVLLSFMMFGTTTYSAEPIKIGFNLEMTGAVAGYGQMGWEGAQLIKELVPLEVLGRPVQFVLVDNKSDRVESSNATSRLIEREKVVAIIGPMISGSMMAAGDICEKKQVPILGPASTNPLTTQGKKYVFRACYTDSFQAKIAAKYAYEDLGARKAAVLFDISNDYCVALGQYFKDSFESLGGKIVAFTPCNAGDQDFSAQLTAIKTQNPDVIYLPNYYEEVGLILRQAKDLGLKQPMISADGVDVPEIFEIAGPAIEGLMHTAHWHEKAGITDIGKKYITAYNAKHSGKEVNSFGALTADCVLMVLDAIKRAGSADPKKIRDALEATENLEVVTGYLSIEKGDAVKGAVIREARGGKWAFKSVVSP